ncbi:putative ABC transporter ATP-binding protein YxlF [compost metagenome]
MLVHGHSIRNDFKQAIAHIGAIIENPEFYSHMTGLDNLLQYVRMSDGISKSRITEVVELVGLQEAMNKKVKAYSLGMRQRLGIAQALLHSPKLLILDEPTNGLDPAGIREMRDYMRKIAEVEGISILISSHMLGEIEQICHRAVVIQNGTLVRVTRLGAEAQTEGEVALTVRVDNIAAAQAVIQAEDGVKLTGADELHSELNIRLYDHKVPELVAALGAAKVGVYRITEHKQSLEEDFLNWTGGNRIA